MTSISTQLEEIVVNLACAAHNIGATSDKLSDEENDKRLTEAEDGTNLELLALISTILTEVIGEDIPTPEHDSDEYGCSIRCECIEPSLNQLRDEQRATATRLLGLK